VCSSDLKQAIEAEKNAAMAELKNQVSEFSLQIAEQLLRKELSDKQAHAQLVEKMLAETKLN
jgi:F-type H+-transporting ATPase subunit b